MHLLLPLESAPPPVPSPRLPVSQHSYSALQRHNTKNLKQIVPEKELRGLSPNFHFHVPVSDLSSPTIGLHILLQVYMWADPGNI